MKFSQSIMTASAILSLCGCALASSYGAAAPVGYAAHVAAPAVYAAPAAAPAYSAVYPQYHNADVAASAITDLAAAKASAAKLESINWDALRNYGYQIGVPLLVKQYGPLTSLYSALAPKRSFVGTIDAGFYKDSYGKLKFRDETAVGAIAV